MITAQMKLLVSRFLPEVNGLGLYADAVKKQLENAPDVIGMQEIPGAEVGIRHGKS